MEILLKWILLSFKVQVYLYYFFHCMIKTAKWPWTLKGQSTPYTCLQLPRLPNFTPLFSTDTSFLSYTPFSDKCTKWPPKYIGHLFRAAPFFSKKVHQMIPYWPWHVQSQKHTYTYYIHPRGPKFRLFHSTMTFSEKLRFFFNFSLITM